MELAESGVNKLQKNYNVSYFEYLVDGLPQSRHKSRNNHPLTDLNNKNIADKHLGALKQFLNPKKSGSPSKLIFYHDYIFGTGQASILEATIQNYYHQNDIASTLWRISLSQLEIQQTTENVVKFIEILKNCRQFQGTIILDLYCLGDLCVLPYLYALRQTHKYKVIIYAHYSQIQLVSGILADMELIELLYGFDTPFDINQGDALHQLISFLHQNMKYPPQDRQDIAIFHKKSDDFQQKIQHMLRINGLQKQTKIISAHQHQFVANPSQIFQIEDQYKCRIIIAENTSSLYRLLKNTGLDLSNLYLVLDFGMDHSIYFDYQMASMVEEGGIATHEERCRRINLIRGKVCQYIYDNSVDMIGQSDQNECIKGYKQNDLGNYIILMKYLGLSSNLPIFRQTIQTNVQYFESMIPEVTAETLKLILNPHSHLPMVALFINHQIHAQKQPWFSEILLLTFAIWVSQNLQERQKLVQDNDIYFNQIQQEAFEKSDLVNQQIDYKKPCAVWMQSGYLQAALDLIIKLHNLILENKKNEQFDIEPYRKKFQYSKFAHQQITHQFNAYKKCFKVSHNCLDGFEFNQEAFQNYLSYLVETMKISVRFFSGSRRLGYFRKGRKQGSLISKSSLSSQLNQRPNFLYLMRLIKNQDSPLQILLSNNISDEVMLTSYGSLGNQSKQSFGEAQIQFHNINSSIINHLTKYNGVQLQNFEREHECSVEINEGIGMISIQCSKLKQQTIRNIFDERLTNLRTMFHNQSKVFNHSKTLKVVMGSGAQIQDLIVKEASEQFKLLDEGILKNISKDATLEDLKDLFDEFVQLKEIMIFDKQETKEAIVKFYSHLDYKKFVQHFNGCEYLGSTMYVEAYHYVNKTYAQEKYMLFQWNAWKSMGEGFVQFESEIAAKSAQADIKLTNMIDQTKVELTRSQRELYISKLRSTTDEKFLYSLLLPHGKINKIEIKRSHFSQAVQNQLSVTNVINRAFKGDNVVFTVGQIQKGKNGYRSAKINFRQEKYMKEAYFLFNQISGSLGKGRLYANIYSTYPISISQSQNKYIPVYRSILEEISEKLSRPKMFDLEIIKELNGCWIIVKSNEEAEIQIVKTMLFDVLKGKQLQLNIADHSQLMTEFAFKSLKELQSKYPVKIVADFNTKSIQGVGRSNILLMVEKQINTKILKSFTCSFQLYNKAYRYIQKKFEEIKAAINGETLDSIYLQKITKSMIMIGKIEDIEKSKEKLTKILQSMAKSENRQDEEICGVCAQPHNHPYKLQACGHKFCYECLSQTVEISSKDISLYPIKCPECLEKIYICDLNNLVSSQDWTLILKISINNFISQNSERYIHCYTAQCPQINIIEFSSWFRCRECKKGYCLKCRNQYHPGITCEEARYGSDRMFDEFMKSVGGRICANKSCRAPIWRISGCFKVQCAKCKKCMCFKCPQNKMQAYNTPQETYDHLNNIHGGCF